MLLDERERDCTELGVAIKLIYIIDRWIALLID
jgi:hypothetical protein